jgi:hypothetical protein
MENNMNLFELRKECSKLSFVCKQLNPKQICQSYYNTTNAPSRVKKKVGFYSSNRKGTLNNKANPKNSNRHEEHLCIALYNAFSTKNFPVSDLENQKFVDYQTPIKCKRPNKGWGKIDLLGFSQNKAFFWEVKWPGNNQNPAYALIELLAYLKAFDTKEDSSKKNFGTLVDEIIHTRGITPNNANAIKNEQQGLCLAAPSDYWERFAEKENGMRNEKLYADFRKKFVEILKEVHEQIGVKIFCCNLGAISKEKDIEFPNNKPQFCKDFRLNPQEVEWTKISP